MLNYINLRALTPLSPHTHTSGLPLEKAGLHTHSSRLRLVPVGLHTHTSRLCLVLVGLHTHQGYVWCWWGYTHTPRLCLVPVGLHTHHGYVWCRRGSSIRLRARLKSTELSSLQPCAFAAGLMGSLCRAPGRPTSRHADNSVAFWQSAQFHGGADQPERGAGFVPQGKTLGLITNLHLPSPYISCLVSTS